MGQYQIHELLAYVLVAYCNSVAGCKDYVSFHKKCGLNTDAGVDLDQTSWSEALAFTKSYQSSWSCKNLLHVARSSCSLVYYCNSSLRNFPEIYSKTTCDKVI